MTQVTKVRNHHVRLWFIHLLQAFILMAMVVAIRVSGMIRSMISQVVNIDPVQVSYTIECYRDQKQAPQDAFDAT